MFSHFVLVAQNEEVNYDYLMLQIEADLKLGKIRSLRDLGSVLGQEEQRLRIHQLVKDYTLFLPEEFDLSKPIGQESFLKFYYDNVQDFKYSELLNAFYITPIEFRDVKFSMKSFRSLSAKEKAMSLRRFVLDYERAYAKQDGRELEAVIKKIAAIKTQESYLFLINILEHEILHHKKYPNREEIAQYIAEVIADFPDERAMNALFEGIAAKLLTPNQTASLLARQTNQLPSQIQDANLLMREYQHKQDSLGGFEAMRANGYVNVYDFRESFFGHPVDYYGRILSLSEQRPWLQHNAIEDVVKTKHPRALFYIASQVYQYRDRLDIDKSVFVEKLEALTELKISVEGREGKSTSHNWNSDRIAQLNYITYWATHYNDYEWDEIRGQFINKTEQLELTENYERLFRRLNSKNDSVAQQAWFLLSEGDPVEVVGLANKYKELLRNYNKSLPSFKYSYLEKTVELVDFCKRNKIHYHPTSKVAYWLQKLTKSVTEQERYHLENRIINSLTVDEITVVEYWGLINEQNETTSFSVGRILDWFYSENWDKIINNDVHLRSYLKKSVLFSEIGVMGVCNHYMNKFGRLYPQLEERLNGLLRVETDEDIISAIEFLLYNKRKDNRALLHAFFNAPISISKKEIKNLPEPNSDDYALLFEKLKTETDRSGKRLLFQYLEKHVDVEYVPELMELVSDKGNKKYVVEILEDIYNHYFPNDEDWLVYWEKDKKNYRKWTKKFFIDRLKLVEDGTDINIKDLNALAKSEYYNSSKHKTTILKALSLLDDVKYVRRLRLKEALSLKGDLKYFENLELSAKELDDIPRLFDLAEPKLMVEYLVAKGEVFEMEDKGSLFNNLFRDNWFANYVNDGKIEASAKTYIATLLKQYLDESRLISEYEEQATIRNIALLNLSGLPLKEKIKMLLELQPQIGGDTFDKVQKAVLSRIDYSEIGDVAPFFADLTALQQYNFLNKDFGIPIFDLMNVEVQQNFIKIYQESQRSEVLLYDYYLSQFKVNYKDEKGGLNYGKIYRILKYDIVTPFVGEGGNRRDYFTYAVIKILEKQFKTNLGFHVKLNENQNFYSFSAAKRAKAWMEYLETERLVTTTTKSKSFNWTRID